MLVHGQAGLDMALKTTNILYQQDLNTLAKLSLDEARLVNIFDFPIGFARITY